jgi:hypothetical protein
MKLFYRRGKHHMFDIDARNVHNKRGRDILPPKIQIVGE